MADSFNTSGQCQCGHARFSISGRPLVRGFCHCLICQAFNQAAFADITVFYARDVHLHDESTVAFRAHQQPPMLKRGCCTQCGKPAIERLNIPLMPALVVIPTANLSDPSLAPQPALHHGAVTACEVDGDLLTLERQSGGETVRAHINLGSGEQAIDAAGTVIAAINGGTASTLPPFAAIMVQS